MRSGQGGAPFTSFREGLPRQWEAYKTIVRHNAITRLEATAWNAEQIGTGEILSRVIHAIEIKDKEAPNNLVRWVNKWGHANRSHRALLDAVGAPTRTEGLERALFSLYATNADHGEVFESLKEISGRRYDLLAYLFFLRDADRFMPLATRTFDRAFELLDIDLVTTRRCSWANYQEYIGALQDVRDALCSLAGISDARLIDAHSFCWMLVQVGDAGEPPCGQERKRKTLEDRSR